jgi:hypothetical protein
MAAPGPACMATPRRRNTSCVRSGSPCSTSDCSTTLLSAMVSAGCEPCHWISVGSAPPQPVVPSGRTRICHCQTPRRQAAAGGDVAAGADGLAGLLAHVDEAVAVHVELRAARHQVHQLRRALHAGLQRRFVQPEPACAPRRGRGRVDGDDLQVGQRKAALAIFSSRLCVPINGCWPPGPGVTPSVASHQSTPCCRLAAATTRWSSSTLTGPPCR